MLPTKWQLVTPGQLEGVGVGLTSHTLASKSELQIPIFCLIVSLKKRVSSLWLATEVTVRVTVSNKSSFSYLRLIGFDVSICSR